MITRHLYGAYYRKTLSAKYKTMLKRTKIQPKGIIILYLKTTT